MGGACHLGNTLSNHNYNYTLSSLEEERSRFVWQAVKELRSSETVDWRVDSCSSDCLVVTSAALNSV